MKPLVIYHKSCADGFGAAYAAWKKMGDDAEYIPVQYGDIKTIDDFGNKFGLVAHRCVFILDFSLPRDVMDYIFSQALHTTWLDHHKTAFEMYDKDMDYAWQEQNPKAFIFLDNLKSGAMLAWEHFHDNNYYPALITHIDDYDRWVFRYADTKPFNKALWSMAPWTFEQWDNLVKETPSSCSTYYLQVIAMGDALLRDHNNRITKHVEHVRLCVIDGKAGRAINAPGYVSSDAGHELAVQSGTYGMTYTIDHHLKVKCSLRSNGDYDVSALAKAHGGGGHKNASGFECTIAQLLEFLTA